MKYHIIAWTEDRGSESIEEYDSKEEAIQVLNELMAENNLDPYYADLKKLGGYLRIESENGDGI